MKISRLVGLIGCVFALSLGQVSFAENPLPRGGLSTTTTRRMFHRFLRNPLGKTRVPGQRASVRRPITSRLVNQLFASGNGGFVNTVAGVEGATPNVVVEASGARIPIDATRIDEAQRSVSNVFFAGRDGVRYSGSMLSRGQRRTVVNRLARLRPSPLAHSVALTVQRDAELAAAEQGLPRFTGVVESARVAQTYRNSDGSTTVHFSIAFENPNATASSPRRTNVAVKHTFHGSRTQAMRLARMVSHSLVSRQRLDRGAPWSTETQPIEADAQLQTLMQDNTLETREMYNQILGNTGIVVLPQGLATADGATDANRGELAPRLIPNDEAGAVAHLSTVRFRALDGRMQAPRATEARRTAVVRALRHTSRSPAVRRGALHVLTQLGWAPGTRPNEVRVRLQTTLDRVPGQLEPQLQSLVTFTGTVTNPVTGTNERWIAEYTPAVGSVDVGPVALGIARYLVARPSSAE